jgi:flavorubredoxin
MITTFSAAPEIDVISSTVEIPMLGSIAVNAFVLHGPEPVLVDSGIVAERDDFLEALRRVIDPAELRWLWLTHTDFDHIGAIHSLLDESPNLRVITTFLGVGILNLFAPLPIDRVNFVNPGEHITVGNRTLTAVKPPAFDNPSTTGFVDDRSGALFSSDCFGALLAEVPTSAADLDAEDLRTGQTFWATVDAPWLHAVDTGDLARALDGIRRLEPSMVLSSHLPPAPGPMLGQLLDTLAEVKAAPPFVGPDQAALDQLLAQMAGAPAPA